MDGLKKQDEGKIAVPGDLRKQVVAHLAENPEVQWDAAVRAIVDEAGEPGEDETVNGSDAEISIYTEER